jgi:SAM-dependent methyltransferase
MGNTQTEARKTVRELEEIDRYLRDLGNELIMAPGSISRIIHHALKNWLVEVNPDTEGWLRETGKNDFFMEWRATDSTVNNIIARATQRAKLHDGNGLLNEYIGIMAADLLEGMHEIDKSSEFSILDIGAGTGNTTRGVLDAMQMSYPELAEKSEFYLVELSAKRAPDIQAAMDDHPLDVNYLITCASEADSFRYLKDQRFDMVISSAVFHHNNFPDYLDPIRTHLKPDGLLVFGDWHMSICQDPALITPLVRKLMKPTAPLGTVSSFMAEFGLTNEIIKARWNALDIAEQAANMMFMEYIHAIGQQLSKLDQPPPMRFLESLETLDQKKRTLDERGFLTDHSDLLEASPPFGRLRTNTNVLGIYPRAPNMTCAISVAKKLRRQTGVRRTTWSPAKTFRR